MLHVDNPASRFGTCLDPEPGSLIPGKLWSEDSVGEPPPLKFYRAMASTVALEETKIALHWGGGTVNPEGQSTLF